ncbi:MULTISPECIES: serine/threonine-protein kinase [unclassified Streptomyces]|uniref:serine/threonine-protein kinase n=1 Tax=unclassified Streptomyces TaxID=2593676 RepID=UPI002E790BEA|nr:MULTISPECIES: serine/threonine-protein kinase [unclassified Streptomyces]MED7947529.1 serine/threonine-protein kinase [Streptomyces sp. BE303]
MLDGRYRLVRELGRGGFGVVWEAYDSRVGRPVAVKTVAHQGNAEGAKRFLREAGATGVFMHPNIVVIHDLGEVDHAADRFSYLVMELLSGRTLAQIVADGVPDLAYTLVWAQYICVALQVAHAAGIVHRDVKTDNIMITSSGVLKLLDFGISQREGLPGVTVTGAVVGTPFTMAPERWRGEHADGRADLYSLGCVLFELCTGKRPFAGDTLVSVMNQHLTHPPPVPGRLRPGIPPGLDSLVAALMAKDPAARPATATETRRRLGAIAASYIG